MAETIEILDPPDSDTTCSICFAEFLDLADLKDHITHVHLTESSKRRFCQFCSLIFSSIEEYSLHIRDIHLSTLKCCNYCLRAFTDGDALRKHEKKHYTFVKKSMYSCSQCKEMFNDIPELEYHEFDQHSDVEEGVLLNHCFPFLSSVLNIKASRFLHSLRTDTSYICVKCEMTTDNVVEYIKHLKVKGCRSIACDKCANVYNRKHGLKKHMAKKKMCHHIVRDEDQKKKCEQCLKNIAVESYERHIKVCKAIKCTHCFILVDSIASLSDHLAKSHPMAISMQSCQFCRRECVGTVALNKHIERVHKRQMHLYKYKCIHCTTQDKFFMHPKNLFAHFYSSHSDLQPYLCKICNETFRVRKNFTIHIKLVHKSIGFVEFDENYHVSFAEKKSEKPFQPQCLYDIEKSDKNDDGKGEPVTDIQTDTENEAGKASNELVKNKPPKKRYREQNSDKNVGLVNVNSDFMSVTETEGTQTETEANTKKKLIKKRKLGEANTDASKMENTDDSDDEPLLKVMKREKQKRRIKLRFATWNKKKRVDVHDAKKRRFTCNICKKYCYTFQNYHHHVSLHFKNEAKQCIKCAKEFLNINDLKLHMSTVHKTSKLTETLRNLLERRRRTSQTELSSTDKFLKTIKYVTSEPVQEAAVIKEVSEELSAKNFLETFTPEDGAKEATNIIDISSAVSIKMLDKPLRKKTVIKMTRFIPKPEVADVKLAMPVKCRTVVQERQKMTVRIVENTAIDDTFNYNNDDNDGGDVDYELDSQENVDSVPEVAQEVMLEESQEPKRPVIPHKIVLPNVPEYRQIKIAHLQHTAPYYKIVKIDEVLNRNKEEPVKEEEVPMKLPDGTKLVHVNPLAHLLGNRQVEEFLGRPTKKYYKPKVQNAQSAIAKALLQLEKPTQRKRNAKKSVDVEQ